MKLRVSVLSMMLVLSSTLAAFGQEPEEAIAEEGTVDAEATDTDAEAPPVEEPAEVATVEEPTTLAPSGGSASGADGPRFRFGIAGGAGPMLGDNWGTVYGGLDMRFGAQVSDLLGIYLQPQLGFYEGQTPSGNGFGGIVGFSGGVDVTLIDRFFVGAGAGVAILQNPVGPELHFRVGGYPLVSRSSEKVRRKGLMLGMDFRLHFPSGYAMAIAPTFNIGYEAF
jgi:hypothetical protein